MDKIFTLTDEHITLIRNFNVGWQDCETGAPEIDPKRPYGNSDVATDVIEMLDWKDFDWDEDGYAPEEVINRAHAIHRETETALQIILSTGCFEPGNYKSSNYGYKWEKV